jgi:hypothetical protein
MCKRHIAHCFTVANFCFAAYAHICMVLYGLLVTEQGIEQLVALDDLLAYLLQQKDSGAALQPDDVSDMKECAVLALEAIDAFLSLAPAADVAMVKRALAAAPAEP